MTTAATLATKYGAATPAAVTASKPTHKILVSQDEENGDILIRIPQRIPSAAIRESATDKKTPFVYLFPTAADGNPGAVVMDVVVFDPPTVDGDGNPVDGPEVTLGLRLGGMNAFVTASR